METHATALETGCRTDGRWVCSEFREELNTNILLTNRQTPSVWRLVFTGMCHLKAKHCFGNVLPFG
jgi:hypothetical protein